MVCDPSPARRTSQVQRATGPGGRGHPRCRRCEASTSSNLRSRCSCAPSPVNCLAPSSMETKHEISDHTISLSTCRHPNDPAGETARDLMGHKLKSPTKLTMLGDPACPFSTKQASIVARKIDVDVIWCQGPPKIWLARDPCRLLHSVNYSVPAWWDTDNTISVGVRPLPVLTMRRYCRLQDSGSCNAPCQRKLPQSGSADAWMPPTGPESNGVRTWWTYRCRAQPFLLFGG